MSLQELCFGPIQHIWQALEMLRFGPFTCFSETCQNIFVQNQHPLWLIILLTFQKFARLCCIDIDLRNWLFSACWFYPGCISLRIWEVCYCCCPYSLQAWTDACYLDLATQWRVHACLCTWCRDGVHWWNSLALFPSIFYLFSRLSWKVGLPRILCRQIFTAQNRILLACIKYLGNFPCPQCLIRKVNIPALRTKYDQWRRENGQWCSQKRGWACSKMALQGWNSHHQCICW